MAVQSRRRHASASAHINRFMLIAAAIVGVFSAEPPAYAAPLARHKGVENKARKNLLNGKVIRNIRITVREIFDNPSDGSFYRFVDHLKISTRESVVRRELLFKEGETYDQFRVEESVRNLRGLGYVRDIEVIPTIDGNFVDLEVRCQDTWTFIPQISYSTGTGKTNFSVGVADSNLLGWGKRGEVLYQENDKRKGFATVYDDNRVLDSSDSFVGGLFLRNDGNREVFELSNPFRSFQQTEAWTVSGDFANTVGRLFKDGDVSYIYRQKKNQFDTRYLVGTGDPETLVRRYSFGYSYSDARFSQADQQDFDDLNLDPKEVSNDPAQLADNRRFSGPIFGYQSITPDFISIDYIDRFERIQDYNLGAVTSADVQISPEIFGSMHDAALFNANQSGGWRFGQRTFMRAEVGLNTRYQQGEFQNTLARGEMKFYQSFLPSYWQGLYLGRHTLAANLFLDYGYKFDKDRQFTVGADNLLRGYHANAFNGDKRIGLNLEDRVHFVDDLYELMSLGGAAFFDAGGATNDPLGTMLAHDIYSDVGVGLRFAFPRSTGGKVLRIDLAFPLRDGPDGSGAWEIRAVFQGGQLFDSLLRSESLGAEKSNIEVGIDR